MRLTEQIYLCGSGATGVSMAGDCHTYIIDDQEKLLMIDCGMAEKPDRMIQEMRADGLDPNKLDTILLTHAHPDHVGGCQYFKNNFGAKIIASQYEADFLEEGPESFFNLDKSNAALKMWTDMPKLRVDEIVNDKQVIQLNDMKIEAVLTPGHTKGSVSYVLRSRKRIDLFTGDTVFYKGFISLLSPPFSWYEGYRDGLLKLDGLNADGLFPSHLMWTTAGGQWHVDQAIAKVKSYALPPIKPFS